MSSEDIDRKRKQRDIPEAVSDDISVNVYAPEVPLGTTYYKKHNEISRKTRRDDLYFFRR